MIGNIAKIETMGLVDGPGIRVVVFLQGCPLRCIFCHNPEMLNNDIKTQMTPTELANFIIRYKPFFNNNGGVTFSGGEPLLQQDFIIETSKILKKENINICIDTSGSINIKDELLNLIDLILLDIKALDDENYKKITNGNIINFYNFINKTNKSNVKIWLRNVIIPNINDNKEYMNKLKLFISKINNIEKIEFLPYHTMAINKYKELNVDYKLKNTKAMNIKKCNELYNYFMNL